MPNDGGRFLCDSGFFHFLDSKPKFSRSTTPPVKRFENRAAARNGKFEKTSRTERSATSKNKLVGDAMGLERVFCVAHQALSFIWRGTAQTNRHDGHPF